MKTAFFRSLFVLAIAIAQTSFAAMTAEEAGIVDSIHRQHPGNEALLEQLVNVNSGTLNLAGVRSVADLLRPQFADLGMTARWIPMGEVGRAGHLVAEFRGHSPAARRVLMIAHLDTVFEPDSPFQRYVRKGDIAEGPGTNDIKGGIVVILAALRSLKDTGILERTNITVFLSGDEEMEGLPIAVSRRDLIAAGKTHDVALDFEALVRRNGSDAIFTGRRSAMSWRLDVTAETGHSSGVGREGGYGAVYEAARIVDAFRRELPEPNLTFNASLIAGGMAASLDPSETKVSATGKSNIIAARAYVLGDLRTISDAQSERVQARMQEIVSRHLALASARLSFEGDAYPAMEPTPANHALFEQLQAANADLKLPPLIEGDPIERGAGDISFIARYLPGLAGLGVAGDNTHAVGETAELSSIDVQAARAALFIARLPPH
jgi:glutamate carboxypeptidase